MNIQIIIPVYKPNYKFIKLLKQIKKQTIKDIPVCIIDSGSDDNYLIEIKNMNVIVKKIDFRDFNHGATRQMGIDIAPDKDIYIFLTQDAILVDSNAIFNLVKVFSKKYIGCVYGRQIPYKNSDIFGSYTRLYNYGQHSYIRSKSDKEKYGIKTIFISNSFAAYRKSALIDIGGFPKNIILGEDMYVAAKMLLKNWSIAYSADAVVVHSHNYSIWQEFKRYFDIGVFHAREKWIRNYFGVAESEGISYLKSELIYIKKFGYIYILKALVRDFFKYMGYIIGLNEKYLGISFKKHISMNTNFWKL